MAPDYYGGPRDPGRSAEREPQAEQALWTDRRVLEGGDRQPGRPQLANPYLNNATHNITQMIANGDTAATPLAGIIASTDGLARGRARISTACTPPTS